MKTRFTPSVLSLAIVVSFGAVANDYASIDTYQGKPATQHTIDANNKLDKTLPWHDVSAFERSTRGLIAEFGDHDAGILKNSFDHMNVDDVRADRPDTVNPSIWRQGQMNYASGGLYQVTDGVYQIRGADLSNMTIYRSDNGYIIHDPMVSAETSAAAWDFAKMHLPAINGEHKITGMIYSHTHVDHFGGSRGIYESGDFAKDAPIIAPADFMKELADENVMNGNVMSRRGQYQYGLSLNTDAKGIVDNALGMGIAVKSGVTLVMPTVDIVEREETHVIDGLEMLFINMPGAEAPVEIVNYVPAYNSLNTAELTYDGQHNIYTFRGAKTRDSLAWNKYLTELKMRFVDSGLVDNIHAAHSAPVWNEEGTDTNEIADYMELQRDNYGWLHNNSVRLANHGVTVGDVGREIDKIIPQAQLDTWHTNGYHGSYSHNARAIVNLYLGYFDMNPVNINPLTSVDQAAVYVNAFGEEAVFEAGMNHFESGEYQEAAQLLNNLVLNNPTNIEYRAALADTYEQQGYQSETMAWRNTYLQGAAELRTSQVTESLNIASADVIANTPTTNFLDLVGVRVNGPKAEEAGLAFNMSLVHPDIDETHYIEVSNATFSHLPVSELNLDLPEQVDTQLIIHKTDLTRVLVGEVTLQKLVEDGIAGIRGDANNIAALAATMDEFALGFEIVPLIK
ncbi:Metallo-beta-lactamase superfamily protein [Vibrio thalassae]|uniref:Metallo-beta-lactamase superfamily protein n=1 Tax=Vibrio thalassae TaxID=1243014 RepID=A0A240EPW5_9VIBR|nr:alkyl sulfatase dimerization domain-containing protein [Vibrio thalassae]SNX50668.1 Metallo-beta-lactamase superfamily protein [Vibrio thalassae]